MYKNRKLRNNTEEGQIIVLLALSLVVVMVVAALAVDGGMIYSERRYAQNSADAASLAGGGVILHLMEEYDETTKEYNVVNANFVCPTVSNYSATKTEANKNDPDYVIAWAYQAARDSASINNFTNLPFLGYRRLDKDNNVIGTPEDYGLNNNHGIVIDCNSSVKDKYIDVDVRITSQVSTAFAHLIFPGPLVTTNQTITRAEPRKNIGYGNGIVSLSEQCNNNTDGMAFTGTGDINVFGGGIHSNSCITGSGNITVLTDPVYDPITGALISTSEGTINLVYSDATLNGGAVINPSPTGGATLLTPPIPTPPECKNVDGLNGAANGNTYKPGNYPSGVKITNGTWKFNPGIYCMSDDFEITGGTVTGYGVMFYMANGDVRITGNASVKLTAPIDPSEWAGMLFFMDPSDSGLIYLVGTDQSYFSGTVFAPTGNIEAGGTSEGVTLEEDGCDAGDGCFAATFNVQLIGNYVKVVGTSELDVTYDESSNFYVVGKMFLLE